MQLMIIPDSEVHLDGHPVLTYSYNIYLMNRNAADIGGRVQHGGELTDPSKTNYMGIIISKSPGEYSYDATGPLELSGQELDEVIKHIDSYRNMPSLWHAN